MASISPRYSPTMLTFLLLLGVARSEALGPFQQYDPATLRPGTTRDPRTGGQENVRLTVDPWFGHDDLSQSGTRVTSDPRLNPDVNGVPPDVISAINVLSAAAQAAAGGQTSTTGNSGNPPATAGNSGNPPVAAAGNTARAGAIGSTARCQAAIDECSLFDVDLTSLGDVYQQAFATLVRKQRLQFQADLRKARDVFINLFNQLILNPELTASLGNPDSCSQAAARPVTLVNDPTSSLPTADQVPDVTVQEPQDCVVSQWSAWSTPLGFGVVERNRKVVTTGQCCPEDLVQRLDISNYCHGNSSVFENPGNVAENFDSDFLNGQPRDILLIIDTSSSIFTSDFELMKEGINTMIDLFCGGFGSNVTSNNRLALLQFSSRPYVHHYFSDPQTPQALKDAVSRMVDFGGRTCTGDALLAAYDQVWLTSKGARPNVPNDTLVITDGYANCGADLVQAARKLQDRSKSVYALGIGIANDVFAKEQVKSLVTNSDDHHIFSLARYVNFKEMIDYIRYRKNGERCTPIVTKGAPVSGR